MIDQTQEGSSSIKTETKQTMPEGETVSFKSIVTDIPWEMSCYNRKLKESIKSVKHINMLKEKSKNIQ